MEHPEFSGIMVPNTVTKVISKDEVNYYEPNKSWTRWLTSNLPSPRSHLTKEEYIKKYTTDGIYCAPFFCKVIGRTAYFTSLESASDFADANCIDEVIYVH